MVTKIQNIMLKALKVKLMNQLPNDVDPDLGIQLDLNFAIFVHLNKSEKNLLHNVWSKKKKPLKTICMIYFQKYPRTASQGELKPGLGPVLAS